jgi:hypothetical protein
VHVDRHGCGRGVVREPALEPDDLGERQPEAAVLGREGDVEVARLAELLEVLVEEGVLGVVAGGPLVEAGEHLVREHGGGGRGCDRQGSSLGSGMKDVVHA